MEQFHAANRERAERFPENLLTTQTHDAKRSADVRARIGALVGIAERVGGDGGALARADRGLRSRRAGRRRAAVHLPDAGRSVADRGRAGEAYMEKALREAKRNTNWIEQNTEWEEAVGDSCPALYKHGSSAPSSCRSPSGWPRSAEPAVLGQVVLKLTCPGVPDIYQGDELPSVPWSTPTIAGRSTSAGGRRCSAA